MANDNETIADIVEPCPYCGKGTAVEHVGYDNCFVVRCLHCGYTSGHIASERGAIIRHNKLCREAAARREMSKNTSKNEADFGQLGDMAAMREALKDLRDASRAFNHQILNSKYSHIMDKYTCDKQGFPAVLDLRRAIPRANAALSEPPRNCDVGTAEEQAERFRNFCELESSASGGHCTGCRAKCYGRNKCEFVWAQMPYAAQEGGDK